uniref:FA domain-containing protein n=1 Tax=Onchocerca flexuosa TaxID=387005 RepID=A0A183H4A9_9BILA
LIQPEEKPHKGLFRWGSARFRYQGRTQFQSKMASQMFCNSQPVQRSQSVRLAQDDGTKISRSAGLFPRKFSDDDFRGQPHYISDNLCESRSNMSASRKEKDRKFLPVEDTAVVYHPGHYEEEMIGSHNRRFHEPPVEPGDDFVLVHRPKLASTGKIFHQNGAETDILIKEEDIETYPIRYFVDIYHSDFPRSGNGKKDFEVFEHKKHLGTNDVMDKSKINKEKYPTNEKFKGPISRTERSVELPTEPLTAHVYVYNQGYYDTMDPNRTDIDEKGNIRHWLRCYKRPEKSQTKLLKEKNTEFRKKTEKNASKLINDDRTINKSGSINEQENETKKIALIHVKQPSYERQSMQASYNVESSEKRLQQTTYLNESKPTIVESDANKSSSIDTKEETYDSTQLKQTCHLISASDSYRARPGAYGVPSTSYDELLHNIRPEEELPPLPIHEHAVIYHPGISIIKDRKRRKFLIRKEQQKTSSSETSTDVEVPVDERKKYTAVINISDTGKSDLTNAVDVEKRLVDEEIPKKHIKQEMEEKKYLDQMKGSIKVDSKTQKSMHKIEKDTKLADVQNVKSENSHQKMKAVLHLSEGQSKPSSSNMKNETVLRRVEESKGVKHAILPTYNKSDTGRSLERSKKTKLFEQSQNEHILDNTPPSMMLSRIDEISYQPLHLAVKVQNQDQNPSHYYKTFKRAKHEGTVEIVAKENINPASYKLERATYQGPLETTHFIKGLQFAPIHEHSAVYHPGNTYLKTRKIKKRKNASKLQSEPKSSALKAKKTAILYLKRNDTDAKHHKEEKSNSEAFLSKNESPAITYTAETACTIPTNERMKVKKDPFKHRTVSGDVEIVEKCFVKPETYNLITVPYDGPLSFLEYEKELSFIPLQESSSIYHSGISYKKPKKLRDSSTESSSTTSFSSSSSTSSAYLSENHKEFEKKIMLLDKRDISNGTDESAKHKGIFSFWRKSFRSEKGDLPDDKREKLEASSELQFIQQQQQPELSVDFAKSGTSSSPLQIVSKVDSVEEPKADLHLRNKNKKMKANLYLKDEPLTTSENEEDNSKRGKFDLFHFWRSPDKESKISSKKITDMNISNEESPDYTTKFDPSYEEATAGLTTEGKKKPIIVTNKDVSSNVKANELSRSKDMKEESLNRSLVSPSNQDITNVETQENTFIYLKRDSELSDELPLNLKSIPGIPEQEITSAAVTAIPSPDQINVTEMSSNNSENVGYIAKITVKREMRNIGDDLQQDSNLKRKGTNASNDGVNKRSSFVVKGFHLRGPPCDSEEEIATYSSTKYRREKDTQVTEPTETTAISITEKHETDSVNSAAKPITREETEVLRIKKGAMAEGDIKSKGNKKNGSKSSRGHFFSSLWRGSKPKSNDQEEHQKQQKLIKSDVHGTEPTHVNTTSPTSELEYNILRTKIIFDYGCKEVKPSSNISRIEEQIKQDFVPVYDFSYIPTFVSEDSARKPDEIIIDEVADGIGVSGGNEFKQQFNYRSKDVDEYNNTSTLSANQNENWRNEQSAVNMEKQTSMKKMFVSELNREKLDTKEMKKHSIQGTGSETFEVGKLFHRSEISGGETSEEPYTFTQTPPDIPVSVVYTSDSKAPGDFVEQIKQQVTQVRSII